MVFKMTYYRPKNTILSVLQFKHDRTKEIVLKMTYYRPKIPSNRFFCSDMTVRMKQFLRRNTLHFRRQRPVHATRREKSPGYNGSQKRVILAKRFASPTPTELVSTESRVLLSTCGSFPAWIAVASVKYIGVCKVNERKKSNNKKNRASFTCLF